MKFQFVSLQNKHTLRPHAALYHAEIIREQSAYISIDDEVMSKITVTSFL